MGQLRLFMQHHVFAVWDFMLLLKSLQEQIAFSGSSLLPSNHSLAVDLVNQLMAEEECDCLPPQLGGPRNLSHFEIYLLAMEEVGADTAPIKAVLQVAGDDGLETALKHGAIPEPSRRFMASTQSVIRFRKAHVMATAFCFGRERLVPELFREILDQLVIGQLPAPILIWYLERHISLDGDSHGPLAEQMVMDLCQNHASAIHDVASTRARVEQDRAAFWAAIAEALQALAQASRVERPKWQPRVQEQWW